MSNKTTCATVEPMNGCLMKLTVNVFTYKKTEIVFLSTVILGIHLN